VEDLGGRKLAGNRELRPEGRGIEAKLKEGTLRILID
jgi:hypothetical protein